MRTWPDAIVACSAKASYDFVIISKALVSSVQSANTYCPQKNLGPNNDAVTRRTSSVRRNFAATSDHSSEQSPIATLLPAKETRPPKQASYTRLLGCECPSALSFLLAKSSNLGRRKRIATALPRAKNCFRNSPMNAFASNTAGASAPVLIEPRSPTTALATDLPNQPPSQPDSDATVVPALVSIFDSEVTSLECVTTRPLGYVLRSGSHTLLMRQNASPDFPIRNQKLKVLIPNGCSQFGTVSPKATAHTAAVDPISCVTMTGWKPIPRDQSSQNLTGKPFLTYSIGPFIVELFTVERLTRSPER